jgi:hypothetical protein
MVGMTKFPTLDEFKASLAETAPTAHLSVPLASLWWMAKGDWKRAHALVDDAKGRTEAWVHAHLPRAEGDQPNARYWYAQAGREPADGSLEYEREMMAKTIIEGEV